MSALPQRLQTDKGQQRQVTGMCLFMFNVIDPLYEEETLGSPKAKVVGVRSHADCTEQGLCHLSAFSCTFLLTDGTINLA